MLTNSRDGDVWLGQKIGVLLNGILGATAFILIDWLLPRWPKEIYIIWDYFHRARSVDRNMRALSQSKTTRLAWFAYLTTCLGLSKLWLTLPGREILFHHGIFGYASLYLLTAMQYYASDGTPDETRASMFAHRNAALCYFGTAYCLIHRWWFWSLFCSAFIWVLLPLICFAGGLWFVWNYIPAPVRLAPLWLFGQAGVLFLKSWDLLDKVEAHLVERIPNWIQYRLHRYQQQRRTHVSEYIYTPLQVREIRLLRLKRTPWWLFGSIRAELVHVPMYPPQEYEAVSYRWGTPERTEEILLDGARFLITRSAYDLLMARRSIWHSRMIWIDAICINQADDVEKAAQVQLMKDIYHGASRVVVFPGGDWTARLAAPLLYETLAATLQFIDGEYELNKIFVNERQTTKWKALKKLILNDYFTRAWVVHEVAVGQKVQLYHGGLYIDFEIFLRLSMHLAHPHRRNMLTTGDEKDQVFQGTGSLENIAVMAFLRPDSSVFNQDIAERSTLDAVLFSTMMFRATDPRDKVFAVLGVSSYDDCNGLLVPDYTKSVSQVYCDTAEHLLFHNNKPSLHMLALAGIGHEDSSMRLEMPSWVPNFNQQRLWFPLTDLMTQLGFFQASGSTSPEVNKGALPNSVALKGIFCDVIQTLGITFAHEYELQPSSQLGTTVSCQKHTIVQSITASIQAHRSAHPGAEIDDKVWLALVAGRIQRQRPTADHDWPEIYRYWAEVLEHRAATESGQRLDPQAIVHTDPDVAGDQVSTYDSSLENCYGRRFAITEKGRLCWVPAYAEVGDEVFVPLGSQTPFLVRRQPEGVFELVGEAYVQGVMWGEVLEGEEVEMQVVTVV